MINRYEGQFKDGCRHGVGTFYYADGSRYEGEWFSNLKDGFAIFTKDNGTKQAAIYSKDRLFQKLDKNLMNSILFHSQYNPNMKDKSSKEDEIGNLSVVESQQDGGGTELQIEDANGSQPENMNDLVTHHERTESQPKIPVTSAPTFDNFLQNFYIGYVDFSDIYILLPIKVRTAAETNVSWRGNN